MANYAKVEPLDTAQKQNQQGFRKSPKQTSVNEFQQQMSNTVGIAAFKQQTYGGTEKGTFVGRITRLHLDNQYPVHTGKEFINALVNASSKNKPITKLVIASHGSGSAIYMNPDAGLYGDTLDKYGNSMFYNFSFKLPNEDARTLDDIKAKIKSRDIHFKDGAEIYILGCKTSIHTLKDIGVDSLAEQFSEIVPNTYVVGSTTKSNPDPMKKNPSLDSNEYFSRGGGEWLVFHQGKKVQSIKNPLNPNTTHINKK